METLRSWPAAGRAFPFQSVNSHFPIKRPGHRGSIDNSYYRWTGLLIESNRSPVIADLDVADHLRKERNSLLLPPFCNNSKQFQLTSSINILPDIPTPPPFPLPRGWLTFRLDFTIPVRWEKDVWRHRFIGRYLFIGWHRLTIWPSVLFRLDFHQHWYVPTLWLFTWFTWNNRLLIWLEKVLLFGHYIWLYT